MLYVFGIIIRTPYRVLTSEYKKNKFIKKVDEFIYSKFG